MHNLPDMRNIRLTISYDGTNYHGWQRQPGIATVQTEVETALATVLRRRTTISASSRTDAGVHGRGQVANFRTDNAIPAERLLMALNSRLPPDIAVTEAREVLEKFDACRDAQRKWYRYRLWRSSVKPIFPARFVWHWYRPLEIEPMQEATRFLIGRHDFKSFEGRGSEREDTVRTLFRLDIRQEGNEVTFDIDGDGFLYRMVRNIVGTLVEVGRGHWSREHVEQAMEARDRTAAGPTAPPQGLCLMRVWYPGETA
ncbi:MAG: tRNA pseudouridine(38-40) synthase TruA [Phycisphaerae bacterium]|nr:tRNA pseudouridine(38-40) synthase TruA [Phycisphaerae bacterium]